MSLWCNASRKVLVWVCSFQVSSETGYPSVFVGYRGGVILCQLVGIALGVLKSDHEGVVVAGIGFEWGV